jgi:hypothetical protein
MKTAADGLSAVPLPHAVLCVNCEIISNSPHDVCTICGSRSLTSVFRLLGGALRGQTHSSGQAKYTVALTAKVQEIQATDLNVIFELLARLAEAGGVAHLNVEPVLETQPVSRAA